MKTTKLTAQIGDDGILHVELPADLKNKTVEVVLVVNLLESTSKTSAETAYPADFFEKIDAIDADDL